jgi:hypothetical protein
MKKIISTNDTQKLFDTLSSDSLFTCEKSISGLSVKYNAVFTAIGNPKINLIKLSDNEVEINILPNVLMIILALLITAFFWAIGIVAIVNSRMNLAGIIIAFLAPSIMWVVEYVFIKGISKIIIEEIEKRA